MIPSCAVLSTGKSQDDFKMTYFWIDYRTDYRNLELWINDNLM